MRLTTVFLIFLLYLANVCASNEILGCGGFIKSHADIDFSKVEVILLSSLGSVKDKTDCSPNGYFFLPIYDKGDYILKASGQAGWSFEPESIKISFNGETDICSEGNDVNFSFKGFGITGKVALVGQSGGARGVDINLLSETGESISSTLTDRNGIFSFTPIVPGNYKIKASHSSWHFIKSEHNVVVKTGNTELPENALVVVVVFDVSGVFDTKYEMTSKIGLALFQERGQHSNLYCTKNKISEIKSTNPKYESIPSCYSSIANNGTYRFKGIAPGKYLIQPFVDDKDAKVLITPNSLEIEVTKDVYNVPEVFTISGITVSGSVRSSDGGKLISGAAVKVNNGNIVVSTDESGTYTLENIKPGTYKIMVETNGFKFEEKTVEIGLGNVRLPDIIPTSYEVCGTVISEMSYVIGISKIGATFYTTATSKAGNGEWCTHLPTGRYNIEVLIPEKDKTNGVQFYPIQQLIEVKSSAQKGITFSQLRATVTGEIKCLPDSSTKCKGIEVTLHPLDASGATTGQTESVKAVNGRYSFSEILPGEYELTIPTSNLCFESNTVLINVNSAKETAPSFIHQGYEVSFIASHNDRLAYSFINPDKSSSKSKEFQLGSGLNTFCVEKSGKYNAELRGCHVYPAEDTPTIFSTETLTPVTFAARAHHVGFQINVPQGIKSESVKLTLVSKLSGEHHLLGKFEANRSNFLKFETELETGDECVLIPSSAELLFKPEKQTYTMPNDCVDAALSFKAIKGLIIEGGIQPALAGAEITLSFPEKEELIAQKTMSNKDGKFKFAAIDDSLEYAITAEKESYVFSEYDKVTKTFKAYKLCEIIVRAKDEAGNRLPGVLFSLSGSDSYRKNLVAGDDGTIKFHSLSPSDYFLKPMMKEYKFSPNSKTISVKDGETVQVDIVGNRIAFSAFGTVTSLNKEPYPDVLMEAISDEECSYHQEEGTSESNGNFRIRGLKPGCKYTIRTKQNDINKIKASIPSKTVVTVAKEDVTKDLNFIAVAPFTYVDITAYVFATNKEHYKTLRIMLYRKGNADTPIYSQRVDGPSDMKTSVNPGVYVFFPRIPMDGKTYVVELRSTLSDRMYSYTLPSEQFVADKGSVFVDLEFAPELKSTDSEMNQSSLSALFLVALVAIAYCRQDLAMIFVKFTWNHLNNLVQSILEKHQANTAVKHHNRRPEPINYKEIEQLADSINNAVKKKKSKKTN